MKHTSPLTTLEDQLQYLKLDHIRDHYEVVATQAAQKQWSHVAYLTELIQQQALQRQDRATARRITQARFPQIKTL